MYKILRIAFSVIADVLVTACIFVVIYVNVYAAIACYTVFQMVAMALIILYCICVLYRYNAGKKLCFFFLLLLLSLLWAVRGNERICHWVHDWDFLRNAQKSAVAQVKLQNCT